MAGKHDEAEKMRDDVPSTIARCEENRPQPGYAVLSRVTR